jgi:hypothetical protein
MGDRGAGGEWQQVRPTCEVPDKRAMQQVMTAVRWAAALVVAAHLLFAHGCHGDEDNELFGVVAKSMQPEPQP